MKILALNWRCLRHPQAGGGEVNLFEQAVHWVRAGHEVTVLCADPGRERAPEKTEWLDGIRVLRMGGKFSVYAQAAWYLLTKGPEYDCILDVSNGVPFFSPLFTRVPSALFVHHVHGRQWFTEFPAPVAAFGNVLERLVVPALYRRREVITVSSTTRDDLVRLGFDAARLSVVPNGVSLAVPDRVPEPLAGPRVLYLGRLKRYKRVDHIVRAVADLLPAYPDLKLDIAGDGDARGELEALVASLGLQAQVTFYGFVDDATKVQLLRSATVFANASVHEGWGISVVEANACGCPAVAYNVPGLSAAIQHGKTGLLAETGAEFTRALDTFLGNPERRAQAAAAAERWAAGFKWEESAKASLAVLGQVAERGVPRAAVL